MKTVLDIANDYEALSEEETISSSAQKFEAKKVADNIHATRKRVQAITGQDIANDAVEDLPGNVAGQFHVLSKKRTIDTAVISSDDFFHVATHEAWHAANDQKNKTKIKSVDLEEGLTELATKEASHRTTAYHEEQAMVGEVVRAVGKTRGDLVRCFKAGENEALNAAWDEYQMKRAA